MKNLNDAATAIKAEISRLETILSHLQGDAVEAFNNNSVVKSAKKAFGIAPPPKKAKAPTAKKAKRTRRSSDDVKALAMEMSAFIKSKGKDGVSGKEITAQFGPVKPSITNFINSKVDAAHKVKTKGAASNTTYHA